MPEAKPRVTGLFFENPPESRESNSIPVKRRISHYLLYYKYKDQKVHVFENNNIDYL